MYRLLTEEQKLVVMHIYSARRARVMLLCFILVLCVLIAGFLPSYLVSTVRYNEVVERAVIAEATSHKADEAELGLWLDTTKIEFQLLAPRFDVDRPSQVIKDIVDEKVNGLRINSFTWTKAKTKADISVGGVAADRQTLIKFEDNIKSSGHFTGLTLPISDLAKEKNITFQLKFAPSSSTPVEKP